jgi:Tol biopolymer transport system component
LLVSGPLGPKDRSGIWVFPLAGATPRKLIDNANFAALSPDDSQIAYVTANEKEIWVSNVSGDRARRIVVRPPGYSFGDVRLVWSPDGRRVAYGKRKFGEFSIESFDLDSGLTTVVLSDSKAGSFCWAQNGRIIYSRQEDPPNETSANLWYAQVDPRTARVRGKPHRLTNWGGFLFDVLSSGAGGGRLSFVRKRFRSTVYVGALEAGGAQLGTPRRLTFDEWMNWPTAWSRDSQSVLYTSDRGGRLDVFRQQIHAPVPQAIVVTGEEERRDARFSPDGRWIMYLSPPETAGQRQATEGRLMRVPINGGPPQLVLAVAGYPAASHAAAAGTAPGATRLDHPRFRCVAATPPLCVLSEEIQNQVVFTSFDPIAGRRLELARVDAPVPDFWDLSPDGQWIALGRWGISRIQLVSVAGQPPRDISVTGESHMVGLAWAADGKAVFATSWASKDPLLLRISLDGEVSVLHKGLFHLENPVPSPDGRYIAFGENTMESNAWVVQNLR